MDLKMKIEPSSKNGKRYDLSKLTLVKRKNKTNTVTMPI